MPTILHVGRDRRHLHGAGVPTGRHPAVIDGDTHHWCTTRSACRARGLSVDTIVWHAGWDDGLTPERAVRVRAEVLPACLTALT
jgi:hypothetical protein